MQKFPLKLEKSLQLRKQHNSFRKLGAQGSLIDFSSNDYLGFASNKEIFATAGQILQENGHLNNGSTGSRLLSGNHPIYSIAENELKFFFRSESAVIYNSGYDANLGFFSCVPQRGDLIFYDELSHASIRDGINLSKAKAYKFLHNDLEDLEKKIVRFKDDSFEGEIYIVTEAVFSMDGDIPELKRLAALSEKHSCYLIVDEAHSTGVIGEAGKGLVDELEIQVFARIITFGKAMGAHGAAILGSNDLRDYLVNFSKSFIYTTALPPHSVATILAATKYLQYDGLRAIEALRRNIAFFNSEIKIKGLVAYFIPGNSAIHSCLIPGNEKVKQAASYLQKEGFDVKPILPPTVPEGRERLRFCLHSFNSEIEIQNALSLVQKVLNKA